MLTFTDLTASYCAAELLFCSVGIACELNRTRRSTFYPLIRTEIIIPCVVFVQFVYLK